MREEMSVLLSQVGYKKETHPALIAANQISSLESLIICTLSELKELEVEQEQLAIQSDRAHEKLSPPKAWWLEFADFVVMLKIVNEKLGKKFAIEDANLAVNGQFRGQFDSLKEQTANLGEGNVFRNFELLFTELLSLVGFTSTEFRGKFAASLINTKLFLNRESRFFQIEEGMKTVDILSKNNHVFKALRILRNFVLENTGVDDVLQPWITDFFEEEILDWRHSETALARLKNKIFSFQTQIRDELAWDLTAKERRDNFLETKLLLAGAKLVGAEKNKNQFPLQSRSSNATLAGATIFWT